MSSDSSTPSAGAQSLEAPGEGAVLVRLSLFDRFLPLWIGVAMLVGPLIEVPVLVGLVYVAIWLHRRLRWPEPAGVAAGSASAC